MAVPCLQSFITVRTHHLIQYVDTILMPGSILFIKYIRLQLPKATGKTCITLAVIIVTGG